MLTYTKNRAVCGTGEDPGGCPNLAAVSAGVSKGSVGGSLGRSRLQHPSVYMRNGVGGRTT